MTAATPSTAAGVMDPTSEALAEVYAVALLGLFPGDAAAEEVAAELAEIVVLLDSVEGFQQLLTTEMISRAEQARIVETIFAGRCEPMIEAFLGVLARNGRLALLRLISRQFRRRLNVRQGKVEVIVETASELDAGQKESLQSALAVLTGGQPVLVARIKPSLLGGMVVTVGDKVYDASVAAELKRMRRQMTETMRRRATTIYFLKPPAPLGDGL